MSSASSENQPNASQKGPKLELVSRAEAPVPPPADAVEVKAGAPKEERKRGGGLRRLLIVLVAAAALGGAAWYGHSWWTDGRFLVSTDDAYVGADMAVLSPKVTGYVQSVPVSDNQPVKAGDPIVVIDPGDYELALRSAQAKIDTQDASIERIRAQRAAAAEQVSEAEANRAVAQAAVDQAALDLDRVAALVRSGTSAQAPLDQARSAKAEADARLAGANASVAAANANVTVLEAQVREAESALPGLQVALDQAARDLDFTTVRAPYDGVVGNMSVQPGDLVSPSRRLAAVVPLDAVYVDANFKETQLHEIAIGEEVRIEVDALPGVEIRGTVASLAPASGSVFSLLPADNATGNFTKIVQRVPVRIAIDPSDAHAGSLRPGLSATVSVDTRTAPDPSRTLAAN